MNFKKWIWLAPLLVTCIQCATPKKQVVESEVFQLKTYQDSISYAMGVNSGENLRKLPEGIFNLKVFEKALQESYKDSVSLTFDDTAMQKLFQKLNDTMQKIEKLKQEKLVAENKEKGAAFLKQNAQRPEVQTTASGLQYEVLRPDSGAKPDASSQVQVNYEGRLLDGTVFDSSYKRGKPAVFGVNQVIKGWTEGLQLMPVGSKYRFYIPADLAYGARGAGQDIGPFATLIFDVELLDILPAQDN